MELEALPSFSRLSERVLRVLGQNPGKFTLQGTNTYIVGRRNPFILVDTGEGKETYIPYLEDALRPSADASQPLISDIILTHRHRDHIQGLPSVLDLLRRLWSGDKADYRPPRIYKYPLPAHSPDTTLQSMLGQLSVDSFAPTVDGSVIHHLRDLQTIDGSDCSLQILYTPGHTTDSICLYLPAEKALFTADTVLGQGTAIFEDLATYMTSLRSLLQFRSQSENQFMTLYPGHGPVVKDGPKLIEEYTKHRTEREAQIVQVLSAPPPSGNAWTLGELVADIYASYPRSLWAPAAHGIHLHLMKLKAESRVEHLGGEGENSTWVLQSKL
ncbi:Metallo-hydrolase/oxidoreductase [Gautieria morchelliformis]|nr:Metallo-hydrolase/oxidoreductase [Gautieria morchelliformis]